MVLNSPRLTWKTKSESASWQNDGLRRKKSASESKRKKRRISLTSTALCLKLRKELAKRRTSKDSKIELAEETILTRPKMVD